MRILLKPFQWLYCLYALVLFLTGMFIVIPFVAVFSLLQPPRGGNLIYKICQAWDDAWLWLVGIRHVNIFESPPDPGRHYVFVANHISYLDIPILLQSVRHQPFRVLGKAELRKVPFFGYIYSRAVILVDRSNPDARSKSVRQLVRTLERGISVFIFPEGTFNETGRPLKNFYDGAFRIAIETGTPIRPILFLDTFDRMHYSTIFSLRPGSTRAIFLPEVSVEGLSLADLQTLKDKVYRLMEDKLLQYHASWIQPAPSPAA